MFTEWFQYEGKFADKWAQLESLTLLMCLPECVSCATPLVTFCYMDCFAESLFCKVWLLKFHCCEPFHNLQVPPSPLVPFDAATDLSQCWTGTHFTQVSLKDLGTTFHLGHTYSSTCTMPSSPIPLTLFDITGVHVTNVIYCKCELDGFAIPPRVQLLCARWFSATWKHLGTAFMFCLLNHLHKLQSHCKVNLYDFHGTINDIFDNAGLGKLLVS